MINLIPNEEKKIMARSFYLRLVTMFFVMLGVSVFIASIALLPAYFLSSVKKSIIDTKILEQKNEPILVLDKEISAISQNLNLKLDIVENSNKNKFYVSERVIGELIKNKMSDIKIVQISYGINSGISAGSSISIRGIAPSRERLLLFRMALETDDAFKQVDLPISNFIKGSNIEFSLKLIPS